MDFVSRKYQNDTIDIENNTITNNKIPTVMLSLYYHVIGVNRKRKISTELMRRETKSNGRQNKVTFRYTKICTYLFCRTTIGHRIFFKSSELY